MFSNWSRFQIIIIFNINIKWIIKLYIKKKFIIIPISKINTKNRTIYVSNAIYQNQSELSKDYFIKYLMINIIYWAFFKWILVLEINSKKWINYNFMFIIKIKNDQTEIRTRDPHRVKVLS